MHTRMAPNEFYLWLVIIALQFGVGMASRRFMRVYLLSEALLGAALLTIARIASWQVYFKVYCGSVFVHEALLLFLALEIVNAVRRRGLPTRQSALPIQIGTGIAFGLGVRSASSALALLQSPSWRLIFSWDHAFQYAICLMIGFLPVYVVYLSASLPTSLLLKIIGFGAYSAVSAGVLDNFIISGTFSHAADFVYVGSLLIWFIASRTDWTDYPASIALELTISQCNERDRT